MSPGDPTMSAYAANHNSSPSQSPLIATTDGLPKPDPNHKEPRLIVVSNRLPVTISKDNEGNYTFKVSNRRHPKIKQIKGLANHIRCPRVD